MEAGMSIWKKISGMLVSKGDDDKRAFWVYVHCDRCQEAIRLRVDLYSDLSIQYGEGKNGELFFTRKTIMGSGDCFERIYVELTFDKHRRLKEKSIEHGGFITEQEYLEVMNGDQTPPS
jgi:hypothetical protein